MLHTLPLLLPLLTTALAQDEQPVEPSAASTEVGSPAEPTPSTEAAIAPAAAPAAEDTRVRTTKVDIIAKRSSAYLYDMVQLHVDHLQGAIEEANGATCDGLVLFIDGYAITQNPPRSCDPDTGIISFVLDRNNENDHNWNLILGEPKGFTKDVAVTIGSSDTRFYASAAKMNLTVLPKGWFYTWVVLAFATIALVNYLALRTPLLREPTRGGRVPATEMPFSLARTQQAFWLVLSGLAYLFVFLMTWDVDTFSPSVLALVLVSSGTVVGAEMIDQKKDRGLHQQHRELEDAAARSPASERVKRAKERVARAIARQPSKGFFFDVLSDGNAVSLQRAQVAGWTIILGWVFVRSVYADLTMPEFSETMLALMGVSSGTYLAGKSAEGKLPEFGTSAAGDVPPPVDPGPATEGPPGDVDASSGATS